MSSYLSSHQISDIKNLLHNEYCKKKQIINEIRQQVDTYYIKVDMAVKTLTLLLLRIIKFLSVGYFINLIEIKKDKTRYVDKLHLKFVKSPLEKLVY